MRIRKTIAATLTAVGIMLACVISIRATTITFDGYTPLLSVRTSGLFNLNGVDTWNGQPLSPTNMPNHDQRLLEATVNFWANHNAPNVLFIQVTDVITTLNAFWFGTAFNNVTQTGVQFSLPPSLRHDQILFSSDFANPGQVRAFGGSVESIEPLDTTPGYQFNDVDKNVFAITTINDAQNGFTSLFNIHGASRIRGGGVFQLTFDSSTNLFHRNFKHVTIESIYGSGNQYIGGQANRVPDGGSTLILLGVSIMFVAGYQFLCRPAPNGNYSDCAHSRASRACVRRVDCLNL